MRTKKESITKFKFENACRKCGGICCYEENIYGSSGELSKLGVKKIIQNKDGSCMFLKNGVCSVHSIRPFECRIFPFDIEIIKGELRWIRWGFCPVQDLLNSTKSIQYFENELLLSYGEEYLYKYVGHHKKVPLGSKYAEGNYKVFGRVHFAGKPLEFPGI